MDFTIGIVSRNLVTQANFVEFRDSRIFTNFEATGVEWTLKNEIFRKILKNVKYLKNVDLR